MANRNWANSRFYSGHVMPMLLDCNFIVDPANANGLGISGLRGPYIQNVFMNTAVAPGAGNRNPASPNVPVINPNPLPGTIIIQFQDNYNLYYTGSFQARGPLSGIPVLVTALVPGTAYIITVLGTTTVANWHALGVPAGIIPAVGVPFIATAALGVGTGAVQAPAALGSLVASIEQAGNPDFLMAPDPNAAQGFGAEIILQARDFAGALVAPAPGSYLSLEFMLSNSSILIGGE